MKEYRRDRLQAGREGRKEYMMQVRSPIRQARQEGSKDGPSP